MTLPATKADEIATRIAARLNDPTDVIDPFTARAWITEARREIPNASREGMGRLWACIGGLEAHRRDWAASESAWRNAIHLLPQDPDMHNGLCLALGEQGRFAESLAAADRALALSARDPNSLSLAHSNRASALRSLGDEDGADAALWDAARAIPPGDADALLGHALTLSTHDEAEAAVEFCARFVVCALATERGDRPALDVLDNAPREVLDRITRAEHLARAIATVRAGRDEPIPDDMQIPARIVLEPDAWDRFAALAGI